MSLPKWAEKWKNKPEIQEWLKIMYTTTASEDTTAQIKAQIELYKYITIGNGKMDNGKESCIGEWVVNIANMPGGISDPEANVYNIKHRASQECNLDWVLSDTLSDDSIDELSNNTTPNPEDRTNFKKNLFQENIVNWWCYIDHDPLQFQKLLSIEKEQETKEQNLPTNKEQEEEKVGDDSNKIKMGELNKGKKNIDKGLRQYIYPTLNKWHFKIKSMNNLSVHETILSVHETILSQFAKWIFEIRLDQIDTGDETKNQEVKRFGKKTRRDSVIYLIDEGKKLFTERGISPEFWTELNKRNIENW